MFVVVAIHFSVIWTVYFAIAGTKTVIQRTRSVQKLFPKFFETMQRYNGNLVALMDVDDDDDDGDGVAWKIVRSGDPF